MTNLLTSISVTNSRRLRRDNSRADFSRTLVFASDSQIEGENRKRSNHFVSETRRDNSSLEGRIGRNILAAIAAEEEYIWQQREVDTFMGTPWAPR
jgi:hypothetical protein